MGIRQRKNQLILALKGYAFGGKLTQEQVDAFELRYRQAQTVPDQDRVTADLKKTLVGWYTGTDAYSRLMRNASGLGDFDEEEDDDPPELKAALAKSQVTFKRSGVR